MCVLQVNSISKVIFKVTKCAAMPARFVINEVVTNQAGIASFFPHLAISTCDIVLLVRVCGVCVHVRARACVKKRLREKERENKKSQRERDRTRERGEGGRHTGKNESERQNEKSETD